MSEVGVFDTPDPHERNVLHVILIKTYIYVTTFSLDPSLSQNNCVRYNNEEKSIPRHLSMLIFKVKIG